MINRQPPDSPHPQQGAPEHKSKLTGLWLYLFPLRLFLSSQFNSISPNEQPDSLLKTIIEFIS